jgi:hypothetical protein
VVRRTCARDGFTRMHFSADRRRLTARRASRSLGRHRRRRQQRASSSSCCCLVRVVVVAVAVAVADRFVQVYNDLFVCKTGFDDSVVAALVLPVALRRRRVFIGGGRPDATVTASAIRRPPRAVDRLPLASGSAHCPPAPSPVPVPCMEDVSLLIIASYRRSGCT